MSDTRRPQGRRFKDAPGQRSPQPQQQYYQDGYNRHDHQQGYGDQQQQPHQQQYQQQQYGQQQQVQQQQQRYVAQGQYQQRQPYQRDPRRAQYGSDKAIYSKPKSKLPLILGIIAAVVVLSLTIYFVVSCSQDKGATTDTTTTDTTNTDAQTPNDDTPDASIPSFTNNVYQDSSVKIEITDHKVIQPGEVGNEQGTTPVIAIWYNVTNVAAITEIDSTMQWMLVFSAAQGGADLSVGLHPDSNLVGTQLEKIPVGSTLSNAVAYNLNDVTTPVTLSARSVLGEAYGSQELGL